MKKNASSVKALMGIVLTVFVFLADQMTKTMVFNKFPLHSSRQIIYPFLYLTLTQNRGSAFGYFQGSVPFFIASSVAAIVLMVFAMRKMKLGIGSHIGFSVLMGGALGNLWDRVRHHYVLDFLDLKFWPVFNVADVAIVAGTLLLAAGYVRRRGKEKR